MSINALECLADDLRSIEEYLKAAQADMSVALSEARPRAVLLEVERERTLQDQKWGPQDHRMADWLTILVEEVGEVGKAICECTLQHRPQEALRIREELVQTAAVCVAMIESFDRNTAPKTRKIIKEGDI